MGFGEEEKILQTLGTLQEEHRALDAMIQGEKSLDRLQVQRIKKRKLWLKDEIARISGMLHPDAIA